MTYFRRWRGVTDALDQQTMTWVPVDPAYLSRYIENGEIGLDEITRAEIETTPETSPEATGSLQTSEPEPHGFWTRVRRFWSG